MSDLRYTLCPRHLDDDQFWRVYFQLCAPQLAVAEAAAAEAAAAEAASGAAAAAETAKAEEVEAEAEAETREMAAREEAAAAAAEAVEVGASREKVMEDSAEGADGDEEEGDVGKEASLVPVSPSLADAAAALAADWVGVQLFGARPNPTAIECHV